jgi:sterol desaturase/sphingolipid hydroxylase (fatty acid hydroxylase superfamily)
MGEWEKDGGGGGGGGWMGSSATTLMWQLPFFFLVDDLCFYGYHRALHSNPEWYRRFHKQHHAFKAPYALVSHATHPLEMMLQSVGAMAGPLLLGVPASPCLLTSAFSVLEA